MNEWKNNVWMKQKMWPETTLTHRRQHIIFVFGKFLIISWYIDCHLTTVFFFSHFVGICYFKHILHDRTLKPIENNNSRLAFKKYTELNIFGANLCWWWWWWHNDTFCGFHFYFIVRNIIRFSYLLILFIHSVFDCPHTVCYFDVIVAFVLIYYNLLFFFSGGLYC